MRRLYISLVICILAFPAFSQQANDTEKPKIAQYWLVILKTGPMDKEIKDSTERSKIFAGHFANMTRLHKEGVLKAAGPFGKNDFTWRGLFVLDCKTKEEAENYVKTDPSVASGVFITDIVPWYSEATGSFKHGVPEPKPE